MLKMNFLDKYKVNNGNPVDGKYYKVYDEQKSFLYNTLGSYGTSV